MRNGTVRRIGKAHHEAAVATLRGDDRMAAVIDMVGAYKPSRRGDGFAALVRAIVSQQVSKYAAEAILGRLHALFRDGRPEARAMLNLRPRQMIAVGLSRRKVEYLRDLAAHVADGRLDLARLGRMSDEAVIERLTAVKGIGRWTAEMYLLFTLGRPDVLPLGDIALVNAVRELYALPPEADETHFGSIAEAWRPWRSVACWYLYRKINLEREAKAAVAKAARKGS